ncbi:CPBP family glutamic-type intramembrane protease [Pseudoalteromonas sp. T1lg65]|uniref:CPBP family glutamic-type intramembrane protease n=1 Tax=Pseudoalteromonas sp. T1lg65 TaxID=2077101 RepID=UPI003F79F438
MLNQLLSPLWIMALSFVVVWVVAKYFTVKINVRWLLVSALLVIFHSWAGAVGQVLAPFGVMPPGADWGSRLFSLLFVVSATLLFKHFSKTLSWTQFGLTFNQKAGAVKAALGVLILLLSIRFVLAVLLGGDDGVMSPEELLYLAVSLGTEKEVFYHGILLYSLTRSITSSSYSILGVPVTFAGVLSVGIFALDQSVITSATFPQFHWVSLLSTSVFGFGYLWLRVRTGSLVWPIIVHCSVVLFSQFL